MSQQLQLGAITGSSAAISECGRYRYSLHRRWASGPQACWIMLNPSTADAEQDDPTIRRCIGFSRKWGLGGLVIVNLFAWRATDPAEVLEQLRGPAKRPWDDDTLTAIGPDNEQAIHCAIVESVAAIAAWGASLQPWSTRRGRHVAKVAEKLLGMPLQCLGTTKDGSPRHPLYVKATTKLEPWAP